MRQPKQKRHDWQLNRRRGAFLVLAVFSLVAVISLVALNVDTGLLSLAKTRMQNAVDAAALAAAQEITAAVESAGEEGGDVGDANSIAIDAARQMAAQVAQLNGVFVDPDRDVRFGKRIYNAASDSFSIQWDAGPYNVVEVTARRDNPDPEAPDSQLELLFAPIFGQDRIDLVSSAIAFVEARDIVMVLDYSASMNDDSEFGAIFTLGQANVEYNMQNIFSALGPPDVGSMTFQPQYLTLTESTSAGDITVTFKYKSVEIVSDSELEEVRIGFHGDSQTFHDPGGTSGTFAGTGRDSNETINWVRVKVDSGSSTVERTFYDSESNVMEAFGLDDVDWPYPSGSWEDFVEHCRGDYGVYYAGYIRMYGGACLVDYLLGSKPNFEQCPDLWKTPHYPFHAMKEGATLFTQFLGDLQFGDHLGLVTYATYSKVQTGLNEEGIDETVNLGDDLITSNYAAIDTIQRHKQAGHFASTTGLGYGIRDARNLLDSHGRYGARPTILLMTDGLANEIPHDWSLPGDWDWSEMTDFDGDGSSDYYTSNDDKQYALWQAKQAIDAGYTIHTLSVGAGADRELMQAIAKAGKGIWIDVPGGSSVADLEAQMLAAFSKIAANVPPAKLLVDPNAGN